MKRYTPLPSVPVGTVVRIRGLRGPWRHLGGGWCVLASVKDWRALAEKVVKWAEYDRERFRLLAEQRDVPGTSRREFASLNEIHDFLHQNVCAENLRANLEEEGAWFDPRCCRDETDPDPFFRVTILKDLKERA